MRVGVGYSDFPDSAAAGAQAAEKAMNMSGRSDPCDIALLFCTARHNQQALREAVSSVIGASVPIYGGGAVGIITNDEYGYAGDQVGIACLWLDSVTCEVITDGGISEDEEAAGFRLGESLARMNTAPDSPVMLIYDAINRDKSGEPRLIMATQILAGLKRALGFLPNLTGAGMQGDHGTSLTHQYIGDEIGDHFAEAFVFGGDIRIDNTVIHGCHPASDYFTVTKADGPVILEINHKPALDFMDGLLGPAVTPEDYPFFLLLGVNLGERRCGYDEDQYASRLCFGIDRERSGIVMFETDMVAGTKFQIMYRSFNLDYMKPKIDDAFDSLNGRKPVFALYINCAGRCSGYSGIDTEDAVILQKIIAERVPILGLYTGVEIAPVAGHAHALDWSGVLCLFSVPDENAVQDLRYTDSMHTIPARVKTANDGAMREITECLLERNAAEIIALHKQGIALRYELELKRKGFNLLSELATSLRNTDRYADIFTDTAQRINATLNMHKTLVLFPDETGAFTPTVLQGFSAEEQARFLNKAIMIPEELLGSAAVIVTGEDHPDRFAQLRKECNLPYFIASPVFIKNEVAALLLTGRMIEQPPYFTRLSFYDFETVHAITSLLATALVRLQLSDATLKAETDDLTGLLNRDAFQALVEENLGSARGSTGAFMMIDVDNFKYVNDRYGHIEGDRVLRSCAAAMQDIIRDTDIIGRQGGDEFVVFCKGIRDADLARKKAEQISESWRNIIPEGGTKRVTASIGIALSPCHGTTFQELYSNADFALYEAKKRGKDCCVLFDPADS